MDGPILRRPRSARIARISAARFCQTLMGVARGQQTRRCAGQMACNGGPGPLNESGSPVLWLPGGRFRAPAADGYGLVPWRLANGQKVSRFGVSSCLLYTSDAAD